MDKGYIKFLGRQNQHLLILQLLLSKSPWQFSLLQKYTYCICADRLFWFKFQNLMCIELYYYSIKFDQSFQDIKLYHSLKFLFILNLLCANHCTRHFIHII